MATPPRGSDLRVRRTRRSLFLAFTELMQEKDFSAIHIHDITERAMVNRGTFYSHFADKYELLDSLMREQFRQKLENLSITAPLWNAETLRVLIHAVLDYTHAFHHHCQHPKSIDPLFESSIQNELEKILLVWFKRLPIRENQQHVPIETIAQLISWAIFGVAITWSQETNIRPIEQITHDILKVITQGIAPLVSDFAESR